MRQFSLSANIEEGFASEAKYIELQKSRLRIEERFEKAFPTMRWFDRKK